MQLLEAKCPKSHLFSTTSAFLGCTFLQLNSSLQIHLHTYIERQKQIHSIKRVKKVCFKQNVSNLVLFQHQPKFCTYCLIQSLHAERQKQIHCIDRKVAKSKMSLIYFIKTLAQFALLKQSIHLHIHTQQDKRDRYTVLKGWKCLRQNVSNLCNSYITQTKRTFKQLNFILYKE